MLSPNTAETGSANDEYRSKVIPETQNFDDFVTIDWLAEENRLINESKRAHAQERSLQYWQGSFHLWARCRTLVALTCIAVVIGCIAGFLQIFTESLVNWKTGHCGRNWLLNKSFCCSDKNLLSNSKRAFSLTKREEFECLENGTWVKWSGEPFPFMIFMFFSVVFALTSALLVKFVAPMATGSGISEIKVWVSGFKYKDEFLNLRTLIVKSVALPLAISSGLSVGKEGPSVHYATCCGYVITNWLLKDVLTYSKQSEYLTAASGAGVAVAFGSPIGGVLFGLEEIASSSEFSPSTLWKSFYVALVAVATLEYINPFRNGKIILFNVTYDRDWRVEEIPVFIILGIFGGVYGKLVSKWNIHYVQFRKRYLSKWPVQEVIILTFLTALVSYFNEFLKLDMTESMGILFHECKTNDNTSTFTHRLCELDENTHVVSFLRVFSSLCLATVLRALFVIISYGSRVPAGIFVPSMAVGATFGRALSLLVERFVSGANVITPGAYAFLGAAATLCGITNLTLTVVVIMFELTGAFIYIIPTMIVVAITRLILTYFHTLGGIADQMVLVNGFPLIEPDIREEYMEKCTAAQIMTRDLTTISEIIYLSELESMVYDSSERSVNGFPIIKAEDKNEFEKRCLGYVLRRHLISKLMSLDSTSSETNRIIVSFTGEDSSNNTNGNLQEVLSFKDLLIQCPVIVQPEAPVSLVYRMFKQLGCKAVIVQDGGFLQGLITRKDVIRFERNKHEELHGPQYKQNDTFNEKLWAIIQSMINKINRTE
ncbi:hypothetical protein HG535_0B03610 [Zygotorulaspora mrakii]|uniref:Chloride channel protein n=1 Tax=Zygotorulaspora mrakii TaxID=42260 RepID=A0A7H9B0L2_ZYGMR|nr:uncharacterized protein HG535_0B03610 [Zygotorulaspora mrakii]QLG71322.1 hypothetical protein HG535_0B03610 [Zygotorulaspora mrakii]